MRFSVRSHTCAGGASIDVRWTEGPRADQVDAVAGRFKGADFDGMTDSMSYRGHAIDGQPTRFGADFIFTAREAPADKVEVLADIFARADRADWLALAGRFGMERIARTALSHHFDAREIAHAILRELPAPEFEGRCSRVADAVTWLT